MFGHNEGQRAWPKLLAIPFSDGRDSSSHTPDARHISQEDGNGFGHWPLLGLIQPGDGLFIKSVSANTIYRISREDNELALSEISGRFSNSTSGACV
jgi:hypothetical protein